MPVYLAQVLCPQRHCLMAAATADAADVELGRLRDYAEHGVDDAIRKGLINPWCSMCGARRPLWRVEVGKTVFKTMDEAMPHLRSSEAAQRASLLAMQAAGLTYDKKGRPN